jgi:hypothetical protein
VRRALLLLLLLPLGSARSVEAWPAETMQALSRDARKLLPRSLARLLGERESQVLDELRHFPPELSRALAQDQPAGRLRPETLRALAAESDRAVALLKAGRVSEGLVALGGLMRIPADLSDPVLAVGPEGWPAGVTREYYALFAANLGRMPVVLDDPASLKLSRQELPALWQSLLERSRPQVTVIRDEFFVNGRVVDHRRLDFRSPAWAVASLAYSRAVTGTAATWLAVWRAARGDTTHMPRGREVAPQPQPEVP